MTVTRPFAFAAILTALVATAVHADEAGPATRPVRIITVTGSGHATYLTGTEAARREAQLKAFEAALTDAKQMGERGARALGVHLGPPVTVETEVIYGEAAAPGKPSECTQGVHVVFELLPG